MGGSCDKTKILQPSLNDQSLIDITEINYCLFFVSSDVVGWIHFNDLWGSEQQRHFKIVL